MPKDRHNEYEELTDEFEQLNRKQDEEEAAEAEMGTD